MSKVIKISNMFVKRCRTPMVCVAKCNYYHQHAMLTNSTSTSLQQSQAELPYSIEDASKILMNWNYVDGNECLERLRERYVTDDTLTDQDIEEIRNFMISTNDNTNYVCSASFCNALLSIITNINQFNLLH